MTCRDRFPAVHRRIASLGDRRGPVHAASSGVALSVLALLSPHAASAQVEELGYELAPVESQAFDDGDIEAGRVSYDAHCVQCHGTEGDGLGTMADRLDPRPRDFTRGIYKVRHTASQDLPTDRDLFDTISAGMPGSSMPGWAGKLTEENIWQLVAYIKTFSADFEDFPPEEQFVIGDRIESSPESVERGREVFEENQCAKCHGELGRGDGPSANELVDGWGHKIWPADLSQAWAFRGGDTPEDVYRTFVTGLAGTPMPSYAQSISSEDAWHLTNYVMTLVRDPLRDVVVRGAKVASVPTDPEAPEWEEMPGVDFLLAGQIIVEPRLFTPLAKQITVKALYDDENVAILLAWTDRIENRGEDELPPDQVAVQFPIDYSGAEKPYFLMGDPAHPVDCWRWSAADRSVAAFVGRGIDAVEPKVTTDVRARSTYTAGQYRVVLSRRREPTGELDTAFTQGTFIPVAFNVWSGENGEEGEKRAISAWYYLLLEPETPSSVFVWPGIIALLGIGVEAFVLRRLNRSSG